MKKINLGIGFILILVSCNTSEPKSTPMDKQLDLVDTHLSYGNISDVLAGKLKNYIKIGGKLEDTDWLYFIEADIANESEVEIAPLLKHRKEPIQVHTKDVIEMLREANFFSQYEDLSSAQLVGKYGLPEVKTLKRENLVEFQAAVALKDDKNTLLKDLEADVINGNNSYALLLEELSTISKGAFQPTDIREVWDSETGPVSLLYTNNERTYTCHLSYYDDWIDGEVFTSVNTALLGTGYQFCTVSAEVNFGQDLLILCLNPSERSILKSKLNWKISPL